MNGKLKNCFITLIGLIFVLAFNSEARAANVSQKCVLTDTLNQLLTYTAGPNKYTDREISAIILSMHRSILHLEQVRLKNRNKHRGK